MTKVVYVVDSQNQGNSNDEKTDYPVDYDRHPGVAEHGLSHRFQQWWLEHII